MTGKSIRLDRLDQDAKIGTKEEYEARLAHLQFQMLRVQQAYYHAKKRAILVFEGKDAAGKGGAIRRLTANLDPRGVSVWPIAAPTPDEQGRHYLYRFWTKLPQPGTIAVFDRSWYGRVLVERVEKFIPKSDWKRSYDQINEFEKMLTDDGVRIVKIFLHITQDEQLKRFVERLRNPVKRWKLTPDDIRNREAWPRYKDAIEEMFQATSTKHARWHALAANHKWNVRLEVLKIVTDALGKGMNLDPPPIDPKQLSDAAKALGVPLSTLTNGKKVGGKKPDKKHA